MPRPSKTSIIIAVSCDVLKLQTVYVESFNCGLTKLGYVSAVYLGIWLKGSEIYIHVGSVSLVQGQKVFKIRPVNSKSDQSIQNQDHPGIYWKEYLPVCQTLITKNLDTYICSY